MNLIMKTATLMTLIFTFHSRAFAESEGRGGQFQYYTSQVRIRIETERDKLIGNLQAMPANLWIETFSTHPVDRGNLIAALRNMKFSAQIHNRYSSDPNGNVDLKSLDYIIINGMPGIEVLGPFFDDVRNGTLIGTIEQNLLHESLHHSGYNQDEAWEVATGNRFYYWTHCKSLKDQIPNGTCVFRDFSSTNSQYADAIRQVGEWMIMPGPELRRVVMLVGENENEVIIDRVGVRRISLKIDGNPMEMTYNDSNCNYAHGTYSCLKHSPHKIFYLNESSILFLDLSHYEHGDKVKKNELPHALIFIGAYSATGGQ